LEWFIAYSFNLLLSKYIPYMLEYFTAYW
jgi:hypothetical protein